MSSFNEPQDQIWKGKGWSDGTRVTRAPQADGTYAEGTASLVYGWNQGTGLYQPIQVDPSSGALAVIDIASVSLGDKMTLSSAGQESPVGDAALAVSGNAFSTAAVIPAANRVYMVPVVVERTQRVYKMSFIVAVQSGNYDIGMYDLTGARKVSMGSTPVPAAGLAIADVTDTTLVPGLYFLAIVFDNVVVSINRSTQLGVGLQRAVGMQVMTSAFPLPATATFALPVEAYVPLVTAHTVVTV